MAQWLLIKDTRAGNFYAQFLLRNFTLHAKANLPNVTKADVRGNVGGNEADGGVAVHFSRTFVLGKVNCRDPSTGCHRHDPEGRDSLRRLY